MATVRLRPGTWKLTEDNTANDKVQIDYNWFDIPRDTSITFDVQDMGLMDDAHVEALRIPPEPRTLTGNVGNEEIMEMEGRGNRWWWGPNSVYGRIARTIGNIGE